MIVLARMKNEHINQVYELEQNTFSTPWSKESFIKELENQSALYLVALDNDKVIGYCGLWQIFDEGHITNIAIDTAYRRLGIGLSLVKELLWIAESKGCLSFTLEVRESNFGAIKLYEKLGFIKSGLRKKYYQKPKEDAIIMWRKNS